MNESPVRRSSLLLMIGIYLGTLLILSRVVPESTKTGAGHVTYSLSQERPLRVIVNRSVAEVQEEERLNFFLALAVFSGIQLSFTLLHFPWPVLSFVLSVFLTLALFVFQYGIVNPFRFESWLQLPGILLPLPGLAWILPLMGIFAYDRMTQAPLDSAMRPSSLFLGWGAFLFLAVLLVAFEGLV